MNIFKFETITNNKPETFGLVAPNVNEAVAYLYFLDKAKEVKDINCIETYNIKPQYQEKLNSMFNQMKSYVSKYVKEDEFKQVVNTVKSTLPKYFENQITIR